MKKYIFEGKEKNELISQSLIELREIEKNVIINVISEKNSLLKKNIKIEIIKYNDIIDFIKNIIEEILEKMNITANFEIRRNEKDIYVNLISENSAIIIGKNGKNIKSLQDIVKQILIVNIKNPIKIFLDVNNYKKRKEKNIEILANKLAKEVSKTKIEVKMDNMNSYERRIVHNILGDNKYVFTESEGVEPNRYVVIKPKEV